MARGPSACCVEATRGASSRCERRAVRGGEQRGEKATRRSVERGRRECRGGGQPSEAVLKTSAVSWSAQVRKVAAATRPSRRDDQVGPLSRSAGTRGRRPLQCGRCTSAPTAEATSCADAGRRRPYRRWTGRGGAAAAAVPARRTTTVRGRAMTARWVGGAVGRDDELRLGQRRERRWELVSATGPRSRLQRAIWWRMGLPRRFQAGDDGELPREGSAGRCGNAVLGLAPRTEWWGNGEWRILVARRGFVSRVGASGTGREVICGWLFRPQRGTLRPYSCLL